MIVEVTAGWLTAWPNPAETVMVVVLWDIVLETVTVRESVTVTTITLS
jgi:hypothetical protein